VSTEKDIWALEGGSHVGLENSAYNEHQGLTP